MPGTLMICGNIRSSPRDDAMPPAHPRAVVARGPATSGL